MLETTNTPEIDQKEPSPLEIKKMKDNLISYYKEQLSVLKHQVEVEEMSARISEARLKKAVSDMRLAQLMAPPTKEEKTSEVPNTKPQSNE